MSLIQRGKSCSTAAKYKGNKWRFNYVVFAPEALGPGRALRYGSDTAAEPIVVVIEDGRFGHPCAANFRNYLYHQAFLRSRFPKETFCDMSLTCGSQTINEPVARFLSTQGGAMYWFSDKHQACLEAENAYFCLERTPSGTIIFCKCEDKVHLAFLKEALLREFPLKDVSPRKENVTG
jgi:hypothetical protein